MRERGFALLSLLYAAAARLALAPLRRLSPDEAYYVCAARRGWPIVDHPPLLGALIDLVDRLPIALETRVRAIAVLLQALTALLVGLLASDGRTDDRRFAFGVFLASWGLMPWVSGLITTPDAPLIAATAGALLFAKLERRVGLLLCVALAVASKATGLVVAAALAFDLLRRRDRVGAAAALLGALVSLPLLRRSLLAQVDHALGVGSLVSAPVIGRLPAVLALVFGVLLLFGPALCFWSLRARRRLGELPGALPLVVALGVATLASALISGRAPEPNWIAPAFVPLLALSAREAAQTHVAFRVVHVAPALLAIGLWAATPVATPLLARVPPLGTTPGELRDVPPYGHAAWACLYDHRCERIDAIFSSYSLTLKASSQTIPDR